jgi:hypothetical protein
MPMSGFRQGGDVGDDDGRVRNGLDVENRRPGSSQSLIDRGHVRRVHELGHYAEAGQDLDQQIARRAVHRLGGHDRLSRADVGHDRGVDGGHATGERQSGLGALQLGDCGSQSRGGRVVDSTVGVARPGAGQNVAELSGVGRGERGGLVDGE